MTQRIIYFKSTQECRTKDCGIESFAIFCYLFLGNLKTTCALTFFKGAKAT